MIYESSWISHNQMIYEHKLIHTKKNMRTYEYVRWYSKVS